MVIQHSAAPLAALLLLGVVKVPRDEESWPVTGVDPHLVFATCETGRLAGVHSAVSDRSEALLSSGRKSRR